MHTLHMEYFITLKKTLEALAWGKRSERILEAAAFLGCSAATIYRGLKAAGWDSGRKVRSDCGRLCVDEDLAMRAAGMIRQATRANGKKTLPLTAASGILAKNGMGVAGRDGEKVMPSLSALNRAMRRFGCHPSQMKGGSPCRALRSLHPNHVHQMDASVCVIFYLPKGRVTVMDEKKYNKNKPEHLKKAEKERVIRYVLTDHYSGLIFARYAQSSEDSESAIRVMIEAWCKRDTASGDIFHGVPEILYTDKGSPFISSMTRSFLKRLRVRPIDHARGNARATGQAENAHNLVETQFEGRLRMLDIQTLEDLNRHLDAWRIAFNATAVHRRHRKPRNAVWMEIRQEQLRIPASAAALQAVVWKPSVPKTVQKDMILRFTPKGYGPQTYSLFGIEGLMPGVKFQAALNPFYAPNVDVMVKTAEGEERIYMLKPIQKDRAGFDVSAPVIGEEFKAPKDTVTDRAIKRMEREAFDAQTLEEAEKAKRRNRRVYTDIDAMADVRAVLVPDYLPRRGSGVDLNAPAREFSPLNHVDAAIRIKGLMAEAGIPWTAEHMAALKELYPDGIPADAAEDIAGNFIAAETFEPRRLAGGEY